MFCAILTFLSTTNEMQRYTISSIVVSALQVSSGFTAHHQELKTVHTVPDAVCTVFELLMMSGKPA